MINVTIFIFITHFFFLHLINIAVRINLLSTFFSTRNKITAETNLNYGYKVKVYKLREIFVKHPKLKE
jgi:hypothetical protein